MPEMHRRLGRRFKGEVEIIVAQGLTVVTCVWLCMFLTYSMCTLRNTVVHNEAITEKKGLDLAIFSALQIQVTTS